MSGYMLFLKCYLVTIVERGPELSAQDSVGIPALGDLSDILNTKKTWQNLLDNYFNGCGFQVHYYLLHHFDPIS